jgi:RimJ/RimL family protein N-acetyltransferase
MTPEFLRASLSSDLLQAEHSLQVSLPLDCPGDTRYVLSHRLKQLEADPAIQPWLLRAMTVLETGELIGHIGFHDAPEADRAELGFTVFSAFRRQGYAREATLALMHWARQTHQVTKFIMCIRPDNFASQALAAQLGFVRTGSQLDEDDCMEEIQELRSMT